MRGIFNIGDQDVHPGLSKEEFRNVIVNVLGIQLPPAEYNEYWNRIHRGSKTDDVSFEHLLTYYGHLLDAQLLGRGSMKQDLAGVGRIFKTGDVRLDNPDDVLLISILEKFASEISRIKKEQNKKDYDLFKYYDEDRSHRVSLVEFKKGSARLGLKISESELDKVFFWLDKNNSGSIDLAELLRALNFDVDEYLKERAASNKSLNSDDPENWDDIRIIGSFLQSVAAYMTKNNVSIYKVYTLMDNKKSDSLVTRDEIKKFIEQTLGLKLPERHLRVIMNKMDDSGDKKISMKEFAEFLKLHEVYQMLNNQKEREAMANLKALHVLYNYMNDNEKEPSEIVLAMDRDGNGSVDQIELGYYLQNLSPHITQDDVNDFLLFVDRDGSKDLSLKEVEGILIAHKARMDAEINVPEEKIKQLLAKLIPIIDYNKVKLKEMMAKEEDIHKPGHIKDENLKKILLNSGLFTQEEVDLIINPLCRSFTKYRKIRMSGLFELKQEYARYLKMKESAVGLNRGKKLVDQLFGALKKVGKKHRLNDYELFQCFDLNNSGAVSFDELR